MKPSHPTGLLLLPAVLILAVVAFAAPPQTINYQGYLKNSDGTPVNIATSIRFSLYSSNPPRNNPVWRETKSITPANGIYSTQLGSITPISASLEVPCWLGVRAAGDAEMALQALSSVPYAMRALVADSVLSNSIGTGAIADGSVTATKLDTAYVKLSGDTMNGSLNISTGNFTLPATTASGGIIYSGASPFIHSFGTYNFFAGSGSGNLTMAGSYNTAIGAGALSADTSGSFNAASGLAALMDNTKGDRNSASGAQALRSNTEGNRNTALGFLAGDTLTAANANTTGSDNTFVGAFSGPGTPTQLTNATAIGANALVSASNSLVLGGTGANAVKVGIGTETPTESLDVVGNQKVSGTVTAANFSGNGSGLANVTAAAIIDNSITTPKIVNGSITNSKLSPGIVLNATYFAGLTLQQLEQRLDAKYLTVSAAANGGQSIGGTTIRSTASTIGANGYPVISYVDSGNNLNLLFCTDSACSNTVAPRLVENVGNGGGLQSMALNAEGKVLISYSSNHIKMAVCDSSRCKIVDIGAPGAIGLTSIITGSDGIPVVSFVAGGIIEVIRCPFDPNPEASPNCQNSTRSTLSSLGNTFIGTSIAIGGDGLPVIATYNNATTPSCEVIKCSTIDCSGSVSETNIGLISIGSTKIAPALSIGNDGLPVVACQRPAGGGGASYEVRLVKCTAEDCYNRSSPNIVTTIGLDCTNYHDNSSPTGELSLSIGPNGAPGIVYYGTDSYVDVFNRNRCVRTSRFISCNDSSCSTPVVRSLEPLETANRSGMHPSISVSGNNSPVIAYGYPECETATGTCTGLKVLKCSNPYCLNSWSRR